MKRIVVAALVFATQFANGQQADIRVDVDLVTVPCSVTDHGGLPVKNLKAEDFTLNDDGQPREIRNLWQELDLPLTVALVADISGSQAGYIKSHRDAIAQFLKQVIGPRDRAMIVQVAGQARLVSDLSGSSEDLQSAVLKIGTTEERQAPLLGPACRNTGFPRSCGGTALWHGLYYTAKALKPVTGRKAIVVLSDGLDTGSDVGLTDLIEAAQSAEATVYSIKYASPARFLSVGLLLAQTFSRGLERLSRETGGLTFPNPGRKTSEVFAKIESDLRNMYVLGFTPPEGSRDGRFHKLSVSVSPGNPVGNPVGNPRGEFVVRSRAGYWAFKGE